MRVVVGEDYILVTPFFAGIQVCFKTLPRFILHADETQECRLKGVQ